jgi:glycerol-3-phosphate dehydrogenase
VTSSTLRARADALAAIGNAPLDVLVVGGGITGAGVARDAALRGLRVGLVERDDLGSGTSSRSSRLVHGGVRYLEHGHLGLVFESSRERRVLLRTAPHLVRPLAFTWPVYRGARVPRWKLAAGLALYDALALFRNVGNHRRLGPAGVLAREPGLAPDGLTGGATYWDAATDDARLTLATALAARDAGAAVVTHAEARAIAFDDGGARIEVEDRLSGAVHSVRARVVVNAAGPWGDAVHRLVDPHAPSVVLGAKGVHVTVPAERVGNHGAVTLLSPIDGRVMFVLPAGACTIIGTTETPADSGPDTIRASEADVDYLLRSANALFPQARLARADVIAAWAGIRPLAATRAAREASSTASASREHTIERDARGLVTVSGGKLTTYRAMAAQVVDAVGSALGRRLPRATTDRVPLGGGDIAPRALLGDATRETGDAAVAHRLVHAHGSRWRHVWSPVAGDA